MNNRTDNHSQSNPMPAASVDGFPPPLAVATVRPTSLSERVRSLRLPDEQPRGRSGSSWLPWLLCLLFATTSGLLAYYAYSLAQADQARSTDLDQSAEAKAKAGSSTQTAAAMGDVVLESKGYIIPVHQILVSPKVNGMVEKLFFIEGQRVNKDDVLAQVETIEYKSDYDRTLGLLNAAKQRLLELETGFRKQEIKQAKAELDECEAQRDQLYADWKRSRSLQTSRTLADRDYEQAESAYKSMDRRVERLKNGLELMIEGPRDEHKAAARAEVKQYEAELDKAKWRLDNCTIKAPVTGTILKKNAEEGNIVNTVALNGSFSLCDMADLSDLEVELKIQERDVSRVFKDQKCKIRAEAYPKREYDGFVSRLMPIADRSQGAVPVRVKLTVPREEEGFYLKPEMGAVVSFLKGSEK